MLEYEVLTSVFISEGHYIVSEASASLLFEHVSVNTAADYAAVHENEQKLMLHTIGKLFPTALCDVGSAFCQL